MNAVLDKRVKWALNLSVAKGDPGDIELTLGGKSFIVSPTAILDRWQVPGIWWEDGLDRRYYRVLFADGRVGDFYENAHGQFLERWWDANGGEKADS